MLPVPPGLNESNILANFLCLESQVGAVYPKACYVVLFKIDIHGLASLLFFYF